MATGKYAKVIDKLPRLLGEEPAYEEKIEAVKAAMAADPEFVRQASWLARQYVEFRRELDEAHKVVSEINLRVEALSRLMFDQFEVEGVSTIKVDGRPVSTRLEPWAKVEDREAFRTWCESVPDLRRKMTLPWQTVNLLTRERLLNGEPEPPGVTIYAKPRFTLGSER